MSRMLSLLAFSACCLFPAQQLVFSQTAPKEGRARVGPPAVNPQLRKLLEDWYNGTRGIKRLHGRHTKYVYDSVFSLETRAAGRFYYETPDRGRIDIHPAKIDSKVDSLRKDKNGRPYAVKAASADQWISDGKKIYQIDPKKKSATMFPIPPRAQGRNIMDGPLPFLLGMPPNKALQRYNLKINKIGKCKIGMSVENVVWLTVVPKWPSDRKNYKLAKVILRKDQNYLPYAVELFAPSGNQETVYVFTDLKVNPWKLPFPFNKEPFKDPLKGMKIVSAVPKTPRIKLPPNRLPVMLGHHWKDAKQRLEKMKLKVKFVKGTIATDPKMVNRVESQYPRPFTVFRPGQTVYLKLQVDPRMQKPTDYVAVPDTSGLFHEQAAKKLKSAGFEVEFRKGRLAANAKAVHCVQDQFPAANRKAVKGTKVLLVLYIRASDIKKRQDHTAAKP